MEGIRYLANENFPFSSFQILKSNGWDIVHISEGHIGILDREVMEIVIQQKRIIITFDRDYGELIYKLKFTPPGVIYP